jgi:hypothetical protein
MNTCVGVFNVGIKPKISVGLVSGWVESRPDMGLEFRVAAARNSGYVCDGAASSDPAAIRDLLRKERLSQKQVV